MEVKGIDKLFTIIFFGVGYLFVYTFSSFSGSVERNLAIFTGIYAAVVMLYCWKKQIKPAKESYFWLVILLALGIPYAFWSIFPFLQILILIFVAAYWTASISGRLLMEGKSSQLLFFDGLNALFVIPFGNFGCLFRILFHKRELTEDDAKKENKVLSVFIGLAIAIPVLLIILPLLSKADAGFEKAVGALVSFIKEHFLATILRIVFAVPVACYLYGLSYGSITGRETNSINKDTLMKSANGLRVIPDITGGTVMVVMCMVYVIFIVLQGNYLFSAFAGTLPEEFTYAEYARRGFFELCKIATWNMVFIWLLNLLSKNDRKQNKILRILSICLSVLTLLIIATAMSKMGMYMVAYGLTVKRIITMVFMIWLVVVFVCVIVLQKKEIPIARICIMTGAVLFAVLCICPVESRIELFNRTYFPGM